LCTLPCPSLFSRGPGDARRGRVPRLISQSLTRRMHVQTAAVFAKNSRLDSSQFYSGWWQFGARGRTAESQSGPRYPLPVPRNRSRPAVAGGLHWPAGSDMPSSRRIADAGFKDSAVKKLACLPRIRPSSGAAMVATWRAGPHQSLHRGSPPSESGGSRNARFYWVFRTSRSGGGGRDSSPPSPGASKPVKLGPSEQPARCLRTTTVYHKKRSVVNRRRPLPHAPKDWGRPELGLESLSDHLDHGGGARGLDARCLGRGEDAAASAAGRCGQDRHAGLRKRGQDRRMKL
jgi:hypothetical protein